MNLRMKVLVGSVRRNADTEGKIVSEDVAMQAVYGKDGTANASWSRWTPSITYNFTISNPDALGKVLPGQFYYVDLHETTQDDPV